MVLFLEYIILIIINMGDEPKTEVKKNKGSYIEDSIL